MLLISKQENISINTVKMDTLWYNRKSRNKQFRKAIKIVQARKLMKRYTKWFIRLRKFVEISAT